MILLLPLRGWLGEAMATEMAFGSAAHAQVATKMVATHVHEVGDSAHFDHDVDQTATSSEAAQAAPQTVSNCAGHGSTEQSHAAGTHCESCPACQACNTVALSPPAVNAAPTISARSQPLSMTARFASAEAVLGQKPPIS